MGAMRTSRGIWGPLVAILSIGLVAAAIGLLFPLAALGYSPSQAVSAGGTGVASLVFRLVAPSVVDRPGPMGSHLPTMPAAVSEQATLSALATQALPNAAQAAQYPSARYEDLLGATAQKPVLLTGRVWKVTSAGSRTVLELDVSGNAIDSKPVLVVLPTNATVQADSTLTIEVSGVYLSQRSAADRFGLNQKTPVIEAHVIKQSGKVLFSAY